MLLKFYFFTTINGVFVLSVQFSAVQKYSEDAVFYFFFEKILFSVPAKIRLTLEVCRKIKPAAINPVMSTKLHA